MELMNLPDICEEWRHNLLSKDEKKNDNANEASPLVSQPPPDSGRNHQLHPQGHRSTQSLFQRTSSYENNEVLKEKSLKGAVAKSNSLDTTYAGVAAARSLVKQDSQGSAGSRLSPTSSGYKSHMSNTPSPAATPNNARQTGLPIKNPDGTAYFYHPENQHKKIQNHCENSITSNAGGHFTPEPMPSTSAQATGAIPSQGRRQGIAPSLPIAQPFSYFTIGPPCYRNMPQLLQAARYPQNNKLEKTYGFNIPPAPGLGGYQQSLQSLPVFGPLYMPLHPSVYMRQVPSTYAASGYPQQGQTAQRQIPFSRASSYTHGMGQHAQPGYYSMDIQYASPSPFQSELNPLARPFYGGSLGSGVLPGSRSSSSSSIQPPMYNYRPPQIPLSTTPFFQPPNLQMAHNTSAAIQNQPAHSGRVPVRPPRHSVSTPTLTVEEELSRLISSTGSSPLPYRRLSGFVPMRSTNSASADATNQIK